jgi:uncharacterized membrane protein
MTGSKYTMQLAVGLAAIGFLLIVLGWNGAASLDRVPGQMPYLISGGVAGLGLVFTGLVLALVQESRRNTSLMLAKLDEVGRAIERSGGAARTDGGAHGRLRGHRRAHHLPPARLQRRGGTHRPAADDGPGRHGARPGSLPHL